MSADSPSQPNVPDPAAQSVFPRRDAVILFLVAAGAFFAGLGRLPLLDPDEGRNVEVAREMLAIGHWLVPHYDGLAYLDKPPAMFWLIAGSFKILGFSGWAARLPSALAALATLLLVWRLARRMFGESAGLKAGIIFATAPLVIIFSRLVIFDMLLTLLVTAALAAFWLGEGAGDRPLCADLLMFAAMGAATLIKGPVGFLLPVLTVLAYQVGRGRLSEIKRWHWCWGLAVFSVIVLPWFVIVCLRHPDFARYALWEESFQRFATSSERRTGGLFYYVPIYLAGFLPWSFFLLSAAVSRIRQWRSLRQEDAVLFLSSWVAVVFIFFSISRSKLPGYFLPALPPLSILMAKAWGAAVAENRTWIPRWLTAGFASMITLGLLFALSPQWMELGHLRFRLVRRMPTDVAALLNPTLFYTGLMLMALGVVGRDLMARRRSTAVAISDRRPGAAAAFTLMALTAPLIILRWFPALRLYAAADSSRTLARTILASPGKDLPVYGYYFFKPGLPFYLRRPIGLITTDGDELTSHYIASQWRKIEPDAPGLFLPPSEIGPELRWDPHAPLLVRGKTWQAEERSSGSSPALVIMGNQQASGFAAPSGAMKPEWTGWKYSVWEAGR